ncbi:hypothetical protein PYCC9005_006021 [Savitreella phatthalungensis]
MTAVLRPGSAGSSWQSRNQADVEREPLLAHRTSVANALKTHDLDNFPVYQLTLTIRDLVDKAVDTTLTWEQLRSPQLNSFLVKPLQLKCKDLKSRAIIFCLLVNCSQYRQEAAEDSVQAGAKGTRALTCELLAVKMLKDFSPRELIDVLCFDFWPLQGDPNQLRRTPHRSQRISALEVAIKSMSKKFLSTPIVVQVLEHIWKGNIVFYGASDKDAMFLPHNMRKAATTYDAREASLFKLSRLRVPRYRHWMQTLSFAILLGLVIAVLLERERTLRPFEIVMVVYAFGFMVDELVGLNSTGSTLFLSNLWNAFDLLTLMFFIGFFVLRVYGLFYWTGENDDMAYFAYDILAVNTVFLVPRLFSALDHTRQFSQMLIAFQRMAVDLVTSVIFILIFFAGFFLAISLAFARNLYSAKEVAFKLLQLIFGFSPAAWALLPEINWIGKILLITFMINTNYLVVTILVSVLSTTFSKVIANAHEEHQYLFALNTVLAVKSDALFFYQAPFNLIEWALAPLIFIMPRESWIRLNRYFIKVLHFPALAAIYLYERFYLRPRAFVPADLLLTRSVSIETMQNGGIDITTGHRQPSTGFFSRRRESDAAQQFSQSVLQQVFAGNTSRRQQKPGMADFFANSGHGIASVRRNGPPKHAHDPRTDDWVNQVSGNPPPFSPNAASSVAVEDMADLRGLQNDSFALPPAASRPNVRRGNTTTGIVNHRYIQAVERSSTFAPRRQATIDRSLAFDEDDEADHLDQPGIQPVQVRKQAGDSNGRSPVIRFAKPRSMRFQKRSQTVDAVSDGDESGDDEMTQGETGAAGDDESDVELTSDTRQASHARNSSTSTARPYGINSQPRRPPSAGARHSESSDWITSAAEEEVAARMRNRPPLSAIGRTASGGEPRSLPSRTPSAYAAELLATAAASAARGNPTTRLHALDISREGTPRTGMRASDSATRRRVSDAAADAEYAAAGANLLSTSLATQLAAHAAAGMRAEFLGRDGGRVAQNNDDDYAGSSQTNALSVVQRLLLNRVEGIEQGVRGGSARMSRLEHQLADVLRELRRHNSGLNGGSLSDRPVLSRASTGLHQSRSNSKPGTPGIRSANLQTVVGSSSGNASSSHSATPKPSRRGSRRSSPVRTPAGVGANQGRSADSSFHLLSERSLLNNNLPRATSSPIEPGTPTRDPSQGVDI